MYNPIATFLVTMTIFAWIGAISAIGGGIWFAYWVLTHVSVVIS